MREDIRDMEGAKGGESYTSSGNNLFYQFILEICLTCLENLFDFFSKSGLNIIGFFSDKIKIRLISRV